jgi:hypothetical protein
MEVRIMTTKIEGAQRMGMMELFQGEVLAESLFDAMLHHCSDDRERYVIGTMLQLETETKARLRQAIAQREMSFAEESEKRDFGKALARNLESEPWLGKMKTLFDVLDGVYVPRYQEINDAASPEDKEITGYMVMHETSLRECLWRELNGNTNSSVELILPQLRYPLPIPRQPT